MLSGVSDDFDLSSTGRCTLLLCWYSWQCAFRGSSSILASYLFYH
nr:MAG TPA: hypothetical protein [Caudoviricetes sp.]